MKQAPDRANYHGAHRRRPSPRQILKALADLERLFEGMPKTKAAPGQGIAALETTFSGINHTATKPGDAR